MALDGRIFVYDEKEKICKVLVWENILLCQQGHLKNFGHLITCIWDWVLCKHTYFLKKLWTLH